MIIILLLTLHISDHKFYQSQPWVSRKGDFLDPPTLEVGPIDWPLSVCLSVCVCVRRFSRKLIIGSFQNLAWSWRTIKETKWQSRIFRKKSGSFKIFQKYGQKWGFLTFAGNLSHWPQLFLTENDSTKCLWTPRENRISRKNLVLEILSCLQIIFVSKFHFWMILSQILGFRPFSWVYFADFAYYDRQAWYLAGICGSVAEKKFPAQI